MSKTVTHVTLKHVWKLKQNYTSSINKYYVSKHFIKICSKKKHILYVTDIFGGESDNEKEEITEDFEEELKPVTITQPATLPPKNKKRKLVDKTFEDEDGFICMIFIIF